VCSSDLGYLELEGGLLELLQRKDTPFAYQLVAGNVYLTLAGLFMKAFRGENTQSLCEKIAHYTRRMREDHWGQVDRIAQRLKARGIVRHYVLSVMLGLHEAGMIARKKREQEGGPGMISRLSLMRATIGGLMKRYPRTELPIEEFDDLVGRYFRHVIWRKGLALGRSLYRLGGLTREYAMLLVAYALIEYFAKKLANEMEAKQAILEAIRTVERDFVLHAGRDEIGPANEDRDTFELFLGLFDSLVHSKAFAASMTGWRRR